MEIPSLPNTGRAIDYWLGGSHYFPIDVELAKSLESVEPNCALVFRTLRDYIIRTTRYIASQDINQFIVFGAGIPDCDHVHQILPEAKVLYSDIDPLNIKLGQEILANNPNASYTFCDVCNLETLNQSVVNQTLGEINQLGIIFIGLAAFIPDEILAQTFAQLYDWAPVGSFLTFEFDGEAAKAEPKILEILDSIGATIYMRNPETIKPLLGRWQLTEQEILPMADWQPELSVTPQESKEPVFMYGCVAYKSGNK